MTTDKETGKTVPLVEVDNARFEKLMNKYPFLEFVEFSQNFFMNEVIPYVKAKKEGKLNQKKINAFKNKLNKHITERNKIIEKFKDAYEENDPDLKDNRTFIVNSKLMDVRYKGPLLESTHAAEDMQKCLANGWAVEDLPLLQQIKTWYIGTERELDDNSIGEAQKAKNREILAACKKDYEALFNTEITTPEIRKELLTNIKVHTDKSNLEGVTNPMDIALTLAINAPVTKMEVGTGFIPKAKTEKKAEPKKEEKKPAPKKEEKKVEEKKAEPKKEEKKPAPKKEEKKVEEKKAEPKKEEKKAEPKVEEKKPVSIGKFKINKLVDTTSELYNQIKGVDFFMFGRGSKEFDEMLKALKYADEKGKSIKSDPASLAEVVEFGDELIKAQEAVRDYLVHKEVD